jgi:hypothetical protein
MAAMRILSIVLLWVIVVFSIPMSGCCCTMVMSDPWPGATEDEITSEMIESAKQQDMIAIGISVMAVPGVLLLLPGVIFLQVGQSPVRHGGYRLTGVLLASAWLVCFLIASLAVTYHAFDASMDALAWGVLLVAGVCCIAAIPSIWILACGSRLTPRDIEEVLGE